MNLGQKPVYLIYIIENVSLEHLPYDICNFLNTKMTCYLQ